MANSAQPLGFRLLRKDAKPPNGLLNASLGFTGFEGLEEG
jgi:hypothetical protein